MKSIGFYESIRSKLLVPEQYRHASNVPTCMKCLKPVDAVKMEDAGSGRVEIRAHCHGEEDAVKVVLPWTGSETSLEDSISLALRAVTFFKR